MKYEILILSLVALVLLAGCTQPTQPQMVGNDTDAHGCKASAGYSWCAELNKCIRPWEENCTTAVMPGSDRDEHGCIPSAGYQWCESSQKCYRSFEENCTELLVGNDSDEHGCKASAGYTWCENKQKCIRSWEENCTSSALEPKAREFCGQENIAAVFVCGPNIRTVTKLIGGGSTIYDADGKELAKCPVVAPSAMSPQCQMFILGNNCVEEQVC